MARKILKSPKTKKKRFEFYFPKKILWNPFVSLDKKAKMIPKNIVLAFLFLIVSLLSLRSEKQKIEQRVLGLRTQLRADQEAAFGWEQILAERPDYRDGWIHLSAIYYKLGNEVEAKKALARAKLLDPTNETILSFEKILENKEFKER